jgi:hypothetical protein
MSESTMFTAGIPVLPSNLFGSVPPTWEFNANSVPSVPLDETLHFDYPGSDTILRSRDSHDFHVPQLYLVNCSPVLRELEHIRSVAKTSDVLDGEEKDPLPVINLSESGATLHSLLTFIFPVAPTLPSTTEKVMELLAAAQRYQMDSVLRHVRGAISLQDPPFIRPETALHIYFLAQKYELRQEMLSAARSTLRLSIMMTIEGLEDNIDFMPGAYLRELWKYHERVRKDLASSLVEFRKSGAPKIVKNLHRALSPSGPPSITPNPNPQPVPVHPIPQPVSLQTIPQWLGDYIESLAEAPHLFDLIEFENVRARHIKNESTRPNTCQCAGVSNSVIRAFWDALTAVVHEAMEKVRRTGVSTRPRGDDERGLPQADSTLALVKEEPTSENSDTPSAPFCLNVPDANIVLRSSDQVEFRVHKSVLALSSPFFGDLLSLPQPPDGEFVDGLPVIQLSEDADLLKILVPLLYPVSPAIPNSYEKAFALLSACQKYDMVSIQSNVRAEINRRGSPTPLGADDAFHKYAIASRLRLIPEMESAARLTLGYPMTFESLGEGLRSFSGRALCDLVRYRKRCRDNLVSYLNTFFNFHSRRQIWAGCREPSAASKWSVPQNVPTTWLYDFFTSKIVELKNGFTDAISSPSYIIEGYIAALKNHTQSSCNSCVRVPVEVHTFCMELEDELAQALNEVSTPL